MRKGMIWIVFFSFIWFLAFGYKAELYAQQGSKKTVAVLTMNARSGVSQSGVQTLSDRLRTELVNTGVFDVLERGQMDAILGEQGFNLQGCTSSECAVEAGKLLGVQQMVAGDIGKIGEVITIDIRVFDVSSGKIVGAHISDYEGNVSGLLGLMKTTARKIAGIEEKQEEGGGFPWLWVGLGVVAAGGAAAVLLGGSSTPTDDGGGPAPTNDLPDPNWPPGN